MSGEPSRAGNKATGCGLPTPVEGTPVASGPLGLLRKPLNKDDCRAIGVVGVLGVLFLISLSGCGSSRDVAWYWDRVDEYNEYLRNPGNRKSDAQGYSYVDDAPDIMASLCALEREGEIEHIDLVFPNVPKTEEVAKFWLQFVNSTPSIVYATANPSYTEFRTRGIEPFHMNLWFKPSGKAKVKELIGKIEQFGGDKENAPTTE